MHKRKDANSAFSYYDFTNVYVKNIPPSFNLREEFATVGELESVLDDGEYGADARRAIELFKGKQVGRNELLVVFTPLQQQIRSQQYVQKRLQSTQSTQPTNVYVSHIPRPFPFADALSQLGRIKCSNLNKLHEGVAFIDFETHQDAVAAINKLEGLLTPYSMHRIRARFAATLPVSQRTEKLREIVKDEIVQIVDKGTPYLDTSTLLEQQIMEMRECITVYEKNIAK